ncbi:hypothetical protein BJY16_001886 [Actinoplanes octamycinicus]|uniref:DUF4229 domain-containing protein n=1 Tax=Actinoplanes octamycinicus TaxID=135948 RepID=A0A7W7GUG6_9ACTN|nr:DUF4229 domain-containing protein [Actinoplanes octamycinicus]MBB4738427.1 hypothetical protein [Actinoplanes octamycinicus]GIE57546.1 hypothetical protein Aoc01nite_29480 [Actinoplanes octamycinicus]
MSPAIKYTLGRLGLFVVVFAALFPLPLNILVKAMIAFVASAGFAFFLLRKWRDEMAEHLGSVAQRRAAEKARLRSALAGDDEAAAAGDRVAAAESKAESATGSKADGEQAESEQVEGGIAEGGPAADKLASNRTAEDRTEAGK